MKSDERAPEQESSAPAAVVEAVVDIPPPPAAIVAVQHELEASLAPPAPDGTPSAAHAGKASAIPTTLGLAPPPEVAAAAARRAASRDAPSPLEVVEEKAIDDDDVGDVAGLPRRRPILAMLLADLAEMRAGRRPKNPPLIAAFGVLAITVVVSLVALIVSSVTKKPSETLAVGSASSLPIPSASAPPESIAPTTAKDERPVTNQPAPSSCAVAGDDKLIVARAFAKTGVEAVSVPGALALGFAVDAQNGVGVALDPASLEVTTTVRAKAMGGEAKRMSPVFDGGKLTLVPSVDRDGDSIRGRRVVGASPPIDIGTAESSIVWAAYGQSEWSTLAPLEGEGAVEALRGVSLGVGKGIAVALRRGNEIHVGTAKGLSRISTRGQAGSPSIATSGEAVLVAWSERTSGSDPWTIRWTMWNEGGSHSKPRELALPEGGPGVQAMSPGVAGIGGGRFLIAWSEGTPTHQVRATVIDADGSPIGAPLTISGAGVNAGQPQVAVGEGGRGVVAYLAVKGRNVEIHATPITCATLAPVR